MVRVVKNTVKKKRRDKDEEADIPLNLLNKQKKLLKKAAFLEKVAANKPPSLKDSGVKKKRQKRKPSDGTLANFEDLAQSLHLTGGIVGKKGKVSSVGKAVGTLKARRLITEKESSRLQTVLKHPEFKSNPIAAITNHLSATLPPPPAAQIQVKDPKQARKEKKKRQQARKMLAKEDATMLQ